MTGGYISLLTFTALYCRIIIYCFYLRYYSKGVIVMPHTCYGCFREIESNFCPYCGYKNGSSAVKYPLALPEESVLGGQFITGRVLGQGGFGITYVAQDYFSKKIVAIKEFFPETLVTRTRNVTVSSYSEEKKDSFAYGKSCFLEEAKTLAGFVDNDGVVRLYGYFEANNTAYFVMDYLEGGNLLDHLKQRGVKLSWRETLDIVYPIMDALQAVHEKGIIHRDISPDNIFICNDGSVKLIDFGAARYSIGDKSKSLDVVLKHGYAPKEQYARHGRQGPYTDIYALAATMYRCVTGQLPADSLDRVEEDTLVPPINLGCDIPPLAQSALLMALAVNPEDRFASMKGFRNALKLSEKNN